MKKIKILSTNLNVVSKTELLDYLQNTIEKDKKIHIVTVNNEIAIEANKDKEYSDVINQANFVIADSSGMIWAAKKLFGLKIEKIPGSDLSIDLCQMASKEKLKVFILGGDPGVAEKAVFNLKKVFQSLEVECEKTGIVLKKDEINETLNNQINLFKPNIVLVSLGAPKQEYWIKNNMHKIDANIFIGVGGTVDFIAENIKRAPKIFRKLSLEWLYRLFQQPSRIKRIYNAVVVFPLLVMGLNKK